MDKWRDSIQNVVHEDNEKCGWEHATYTTFSHSAKHIVHNFNLSGTVVLMSTRDSIQKVVHEDNEYCGSDHATLRYTVSEDLFPAGSVPVLSCFQGLLRTTWVLRWLSVPLCSPQGLWSWWVSSYLHWIALYLFCRFVSSWVRARHVHNL